MTEILDMRLSEERQRERYVAATSSRKVTRRANKDVRACASKETTLRSGELYGATANEKP